MLSDSMETCPVSLEDSSGLDEMFFGATNFDQILCWDPALQGSSMFSSSPGLNPSIHSEGCGAPCPAGRFRNSDTKECLNCMPGKYTVAPLEGSSGSLSCLNCDAGYVQPRSGRSSCTSACSAGKYSNNISTSCVACPSNTFSFAASDSCLFSKCPQGTRQIGDSGCVECPAGTYNPKVNQQACTLMCPGGTYSAEGAVECTACPTETPFSSAGSSACNSECPPGSYHLGSHVDQATSERIDTTFECSGKDDSI